MLTSIRTAILAGMSALAALASGADEPALTGTLILTREEPLQGTQIVRYDLESGQMRMEADGARPRRANARIVFVQKCGEFGTDDRVAVADEDGFVTPVTPCEDNGILSDRIHTDISRDGRYVASYDPNIFLEGDRLRASGHGVRVFTAEGEEIGQLLGYDNPTWTRSGWLLMAGSGLDGPGQPHGIYMANRALSAARRVDDGRLNNGVYHLTAHPTEDKAAFIYNNQLWEIDLTTGAPSRLLAYDRPIVYPAYSPDGSKIAFLAADPLNERIDKGTGDFHIHVFDRRDVIDIAIDFLPGGPVTWFDAAGDR